MQQVRQRHTSIQIGDIVQLYKGRDAEDAVWNIPEHQRDYVWKYDRQSCLIDSVMQNYVIPAIMLHQKKPGYFDIEDGQQRVHTIFLFMQNRFGWKRDDGPEVYYNDPAKQSMTELERHTFNSRLLLIMEFANATSEQIEENFERLNSGRSLSDNDKFWNRKDVPLLRFVQETLFETHLDRVQAIFTDKIKFTRSNLSNAVGLIAACMYGRDYISTSFIRLKDIIKKDITPELRERCLRRLDRLLSVYESVDEESPYPVVKLLKGKTSAGNIKKAMANTKKKEQFALGKFSAYYLYDLIDGFGERENADYRDNEWQLFLMRTREAEYYKYDNKLKGKGGGANNINGAKLESGIKQFNKYAENDFENLGEGDEDSDDDDDDESM